MSFASQKIIEGHFSNAPAVCESLHRECLALVAASLESASRREHQEQVTLALAVAQLAHTQMSLLKLDSPRALEMAPALASVCSTARQTFERADSGDDSRRSSLMALLTVAERTFRG